MTGSHGSASPAQALLALARTAGWKIAWQDGEDDAALEACVKPFGNIAVSIEPDTGPEPLIFKIEIWPPSGHAFPNYEVGFRDWLEETLLGLAKKVAPPSTDADPAEKGL
jgi:hypothetical protein